MSSPPTRRCGSCGAPLRPGTRFCGGCGAGSVEAPPETEVPLSPGAQISVTPAASDRVPVVPDLVSKAPAKRRRGTRSLGVGLGLAGLAVVTGIAWVVLRPDAGTDMDADRAAVATTTAPVGMPDAVAGERTFVATCGGCHQEGGRRAGVGPLLAGRGLTPGGVRAQVVDGGGAMPAGLIAGQDLENVIAYVVTLQTPGNAGPPPPTTGPAPGDPTRGLATFASVCQGCHADGGRTGGVGPVIAGRGLSASGIREQVELGGGVMPAGLVSGQDLEDVVSYVSSIQGSGSSGGGPSDEARTAVAEVVHRHWQLRLAGDEASLYEAHSLYTGRLRRRAGSTAEAWVRGIQADALFALDVRSVDVRMADPSRAIATARLRTESAGGGCRNWTITYVVVRASGGWRLEDSKPASRTC